MLKPFQPQAVGLVSLLSLSMLLAACGGAAQPASPEPSSPAQGQETAVGAAESSPTAAVAEAATEEPTAIAAATNETAAAPAASSRAPAVCQPVDIPSNTLIAPVSDQEWSKGSASAPVTLIEYGDFQ